MIKFALVGKKLAHSYSPLIHNYLFEKLKISAQYEIFETDVPQDIVKTMVNQGYCGFNVTIPYKESILPYLDYVSNEAKKIGAVNLVKIEDGKTYGYNSDYFGFLDMLSLYNIPIKNKIFYILGSGGGAKSIALALKDNGAREITIVTRKKGEEKQELKNIFQGFEVVSYEDIIGGDTIINATPVGMYPDVEFSPVDESILNRFDIAIDIVYNPYETKFLSLAHRCNLKCVNGVGMLVSQALKSDELWLDIDIDDDTKKEINNLLIKELGEK